MRKIIYNEILISSTYTQTKETEKKKEKIFVYRT